jgi:ribosomal protein RSM22 (predicted rRNA methylase)
MRRALSAAAGKLARALDARGGSQTGELANAATRVRPLSSSAGGEASELATTRGELEVSASTRGELDVSETTSPLLPAAMNACDDAVGLLSETDKDDLIAAVHALSARNKGVIELPERLLRAIRVAVRETGATHRQIKQKGRTLLDELKTISRGLKPSVDAEERSVRAWMKNKSQTAGLSPSGANAEESRDELELGEGVEWGVRLPVRKERRLREGVGGLDVARTEKGKKKKPAAPPEAALAYGPLEAAAYAVTRLPMTFGAHQRAFEELAIRAPGFNPKTMLEFGAGPAPALWAARRVFGNVLGNVDERGNATLVDASPSMMAFTRRIAKSVYDEEVSVDLGDLMDGAMETKNNRPLPDPDPWGLTGPVRTVASLRSLSPRARFDLVVASYSLGEIAAGTKHEQHQALLRGGGVDYQEMREKRVSDAVTSLWSKVNLGGALVLIETGTPRGSDLIRFARSIVLEHERQYAEREGTAIDAHVVAPCQHDRKCPMDGLDTWCHFSVRVKRTEMHRQMMKRGRGPELQNERFSYVIIRRISRENAREETLKRAKIIAVEREGQWEGDLDADDADDADDVESDVEDFFTKDEEPMVFGSEAVNYDEYEDEEEELESLTDMAALSSSYTWGRMVRPPMKRKGHVILDLCTADGELSRHIVAKSHARETAVGRGGYKHARKSRWGDLWPFRDPRRLHEITDDAAAVEDFFKDIEDVDVDEVKELLSGSKERTTPEGVGKAKKKPFMNARRPKEVLQFVEMETEIGSKAMEEQIAEGSAEDDPRER